MKYAHKNRQVRSAEYILASLLLQKDFYEPPQVPLEKNTYYKQEFTAKANLPEIHRCGPPRENFRRTSARFDGRTTYKDQHKHWKGQKSVPFGELPSFVGKEHLTKSTFDYSETAPIGGINLL